MADPTDRDPYDLDSDVGEKRPRPRPRRSVVANDREAELARWVESRRSSVGVSRGYAAAMEDVLAWLDRHKDRQRVYPQRVGDRLHLGVPDPQGWDGPTHTCDGCGTVMVPPTPDLTDPKEARR